MKYNQLEVSSKKNPKRVGRGISGGQGKTAGRGTKGQKSRAGSSRKPGFEGGQNPLMQRLPKLKGFKSHKTPRDIVLTGQLESLGVTAVDNQVLASKGIIESAHTDVKLIAGGDITKKLTIKLQFASKGAVEIVKKKGGSFTQVPRAARPAKNNKKSD